VVPMVKSSPMCRQSMQTKTMAPASILTNMLPSVSISAPVFAMAGGTFQFGRLHTCCLDAWRTILFL
jgi:hypothetical protein